MTQYGDVRVLVTDDFEPLRHYLAEELDWYEGLSVVGTAANGEEAVARCADLNPDVILMDLGMPVMDGFTATRIIRQKYPHIMIVIFTISPNQKKLALDYGAYAYLEKGVAIEEIVDALRSAKSAGE